MSKIHGQHSNKYFIFPLCTPTKWNPSWQRNVKGKKITCKRCLKIKGSNANKPRK